jgi:uncharacterized protein YidB (DUF937 family)
MVVIIGTLALVGGLIAATLGGAVVGGMIAGDTESVSVEEGGVYNKTTDDAPAGGFGDMSQMLQMVLMVGLMSKML